MASGSVAIVFVAACAAPVAAPIANVTPARATLSTDRYIGTQLVIIGGEHSVVVELPAGLAEVTTINTSDARIVIARRRDDLVVLYANVDGLVTDDVFVPGAATHTVVADCEGAFLGVVANADCPTGDGVASVPDAWNLTRGKLARVAAPVQCLCATLHLGD